MNRKKMIKVLREVAESIVDKHKFDLVDIEYLKEYGNNYLRIYIAKPGGVNLYDCQVVSEALSKYLDENDPIAEQYFLEVSSAGLDRPLKTDRDLSRNLGAEIEVSLYKAFEGQKRFEGNLKNFSDLEITISSNDELIKVPRDLISLIKLKVVF